MTILNPIAVVFAGAPCTGKTTVAKLLTRRIVNSHIIEKDDINRACLLMKEVDRPDNPALTSSRDYLTACYGKDFVPQEIEGLMSGRLFSLPWGGPYYARHVRDQSYHTIVDIAKLNFELGKVPIIASIASNHFSTAYNGLARRIMDSFPKAAMIYMHLPEDALRERILQRMKDDPKRTEIDHNALTDEGWRGELERVPVFPSNLDGFEHCKISAIQSREECTQQALEYVCRLASR